MPDTTVIIIPEHALPFDSTVYDIALLPPPAVEEDIVAAEVVEELPPPPPAWEEGIVGQPRRINAGDNSGVLVVVAGIVLVMMLCYRHCRHLFGTLFQELLGIRRRENAFDEHTSNETSLLLLMAVQWSVCTGLLLYIHMAGQLALTATDAFVHSMECIGLAAGYYVFQYCAYWTVGYTFSTPHGLRSYLQGFTASQSLLGFALVVPTLVTIFYPGGSGIMIAIALTLYFLARIIFIIKGFRIFYHKIASLLYFILYLCTLEIIPLFCIYKTALALVE